MFTIPLRRRGRALRVGLVVLVLSGVAAALLPVGPALAKPRRADIAITGMVAGPAEVLMGEIVGIGIDVANIGTRASDTVAVDVTLPPTLQLRNPGIVGPEWLCGFPTPILRCTHTALAPGQVAAELQLHATVVGGTPGDVLTVTAEASTTSRELSTANNTGQASVQLIAAGTIRGTAWIDTDRDGQREPGEPAAPGFGLWGVQIPTEDGNEILPVEVDAEGHYSLAVKPNRYFVEVGISVFALAWDFTTPNVGAEATDSDVVPFYADEFSLGARSDVFEVTSGSETVIDIGLVENPLT
jgi:hypothetical protein